MTIPNAEAGRQVHLVHVINGANYGGIERAVTTLVHHHQVIRPAIVCLMDGDMTQFGASAAGCRIDLIRMRSHFDLTAAVRLARYVRAHRINLIQAHTLRANLVGAAAARFARVPAVATIHSPIARDTEDLVRNRRNLWLQRRLFRWTAGYIAVSEGLGREMIASGVPAARIVVVRNGIDITRYGHGNGSSLRQSLGGLDMDTPLVGTHALLRPRKGIDVFLRAIPIVLRSIPSARFIIAGRAEVPAYEQELHQLARSLGIANLVHFLGFRSDVADLLAALDAFVIPSLFGEGTPFALLEAMAASRAVIATRTEGNEEIIQNGSTGVLVESHHPEALARAVVDVLTNREFRRELGARARQTVAERFSAVRMAAETEAFYSRILAARSSR
jgi:glycosyltransferase involved in cell wall biosynthesis